MFSFLYDRIMERSVFPKKFNASMAVHYTILGKLLKPVTGQTIIEFATGSGDAIRFLNPDNTYAGVDISPGLLRLARKKFERHGFNRFELYAADACTTPFQDHLFDAAICNLSMNFFPDPDQFIAELRRVLKTNGQFYGSLPLPERKTSKATIHGTLYPLDALKKRFEDHRFHFDALPDENGALLYFKATPKDK